MKDLRSRILLWTVVAVAAAVRTWLGGRDERVAITLGQAFALEAPAWLLWVGATPAIHALTERVARSGPLRIAALHGAMVASLLVLSAALGVLALVAFPGRPPDVRLTDAFVGMLSLRLVPVVAVYGMLVATHVATRRASELERGRAREAETHERLTRAELEALRARIHPHFLFNALNACSSLIDESPDEARRLLARLGDVLRAAFDGPTRDTVSLREELATVEAYLDVERARFGERLQVRVDVDDAFLDLPMPTLTLQPLVENAVRHGVGPVSHRCTILIAASVADGALELEVRDDGAGLEPGYVEGSGLSITRARLERRYGSRRGLHIGPLPGGGTAVRIRVPLDAPAPAISG